MDKLGFRRPIRCHRGDEWGVRGGECGNIHSAELPGRKTLAISMKLRSRNTYGYIRLLRVVTVLCLMRILLPILLCFRVSDGNLASSRHRQGECVSLVMGSMLLSREGLLREGGQLPPWVSSMRGWRWSYYFAKVDARRCWLTMDDIVRSPWTVSGRHVCAGSRGGAGDGGMEFHC